MSINWIATAQRRPDPVATRVLALDRRTGYVTILWYEEIDEFRNGEWRENREGQVSTFAFTHWAPITLPM